MSGEEPVIRSFQYPQDYQECLRLWEKCGPGVVVGRSDSPEEIQKKATRDPELFLLAIIQDQLVGTVIGAYDGRRGMVYHFAVDPHFRRRGIGRLLMAELERRFKKIGCVKAYLLMLPENPAAHFYQECGWQEMQVRIFAKEFRTNESA